MLSRRQLTIGVALAVGLGGGAFWVAGVGDSPSRRVEEPSSPRPPASSPRRVRTEAPAPATPTPEPQRLSTSERRLNAESELDRQGAAARAELIARQTRQLEGAIGRAEERGNTERARLMRARVDALERARDSTAPH